MFRTNNCSSPGGLLQAAYSILPGIVLMMMNNYLFETCRG